MEWFTLIQPKYPQFPTISIIAKVSLSSHSIIQKDPQSRIKKKRYML